MRRFLDVLLVPGDIVLHRPIEAWLQDGKKKSRVINSEVVYDAAGSEDTPRTVAKLLDVSKRERANLFFGVCPRFGGGGRYDLAWQIRVVRCLWTDIDHITVAEALDRAAKAGLLPPSIVVNSGNGVHLYWLLDVPYLIDDVGDPPPVETEWVSGNKGRRKSRKYIVKEGERCYLNDDKELTRLSPKAEHIQNVLAGIARAVGGDHTTDLVRLLRIPGTLNRKDERNGRPPVPTELVVCDSSRRYPITVFESLAVSSAPASSPDDKAKTARSTTNRVSSKEGWVRVSKQYLCPICQKPDNCQVSEDGKAVWCGRIAKGSVRQNNGGQHLHRLNPTSLGFTLPPKKKHSPEPVTRDWPAYAKEMARNADAARQQLAERLGVSLDSLEQLNVGWNPSDGFWSVPERNGDGEVIGISARYRSGEKKRLAGGQAGLTYADDWDTGVGPILLVEGGSDTAALLTLGLTVVGRPSNSGGVDLLLDLLEHIPPDRDIIVIGERDEKDDGKWPGKEGAIRTATRLAESLERPVAWSLPPDHAKDSRAWLQAMSAIPQDRQTDLFLSGLDPVLIHPPLTLPPPEVIGPIIDIANWRQDMLAARLQSLKRPGIYLDASSTGAGKSRVDFETILYLCGMECTA
ncbi:MAG: hypothetical protein WEB58_04595 [Planctomycetaceae bacterium]